MNNFRIASLLLDNPVEFPLDDEWLRLLRAEFDAHEADTNYLFGEFYRLLKLEPIPDTTFKSHHIEQLPSGSYRVRFERNTGKQSCTFKTLDEARWFRNKMFPPQQSMQQFKE